MSHDTRYLPADMHSHWWRASRDWCPPLHWINFDVLLTDSRDIDLIFTSWQLSMIPPNIAYGDVSGEHVKLLYSHVKFKLSVLYPSSSDVGFSNLTVFSFVFRQQIALCTGMVSILWLSFSMLFSFPCWYNYGTNQDKIEC